MGGRIGFAIGEEWLIDSPALMRQLPPGQHCATLVQKMLGRECRDTGQSGPRDRPGRR